jgi:hypothetical protein
MTRRERFRSYIASVDPATNPLTAIERGFYVGPPGAIANQIVGRFEIEPKARHLIVGGIGSGKTTQLLVCANLLNEISDITAAYVDVSSKQDLGKLRPGCLLAMASRELLTRADGIEKSVAERVLGWANGYTCYWDPWEGAADEDPFVAGIISAPEPEWTSIEQRHVDDLRVIAGALLNQGKHAVVLFDSMDRMSDNKAFSDIVREDVAALHACGIGIVLVGPIRSLEGFGRIDADRFDHLHIQAPINVKTDTVGRQFLESALERRAMEDVLSGEVRSELVRWSGGVLRDLMSLAKLAGEEAYLDGADAIMVVHAKRAADRFGRSLLMGLRQDELDRLKQVHASGRFVQASPSDMALIATRRVLEYRDQSGTYAVHPVVAPLLADLGSAP